MGHTAEFIAQIHNISRQEMDEVALKSHNCAERATVEGDFKDEIVPIDLHQKKGKPPRVFDKDEHFRPGITMAELADLPPAFIPKTGKVTAGNPSGLNDGASAMIIMSADKAKELGFNPLACIIVTLIHSLRRRGKNLGLATLCGGGGVSMATAFEII